MAVSLKNVLVKIPNIITVVFSVYVAGTLLLNVILNNSFIILSVTVQLYTNSQKLKLSWPNCSIPSGYTL